ncbi:hypothetical protein JZ751_019018, partial [Albula glossodonta]
MNSEGLGGEGVLEQTLQALPPPHPQKQHWHQDQGEVATEKVAGKLSSTLSWVKNSVSHTVSQMASQVATPSSLHTTTSSSTTLSSPVLTPSSPTELSPDEVELLAKLEEQN